MYDFSFLEFYMYDFVHRGQIWSVRDFVKFFKKNLDFFQNALTFLIFRVMHSDLERLVLGSETFVSEHSHNIYGWFRSSDHPWLMIKMISWKRSNLPSRFKHRLPQTTVQTQVRPWLSGLWSEQLTEFSDFRCARIYPETNVSDPSRNFFKSECTIPKNKKNRAFWKSLNFFWKI